MEGEKKENPKCILPSFFFRRLRKPGSSTGNIQDSLLLLKCNLVDSINTHCKRTHSDPNALNYKML